MLFNSYLFIFIFFPIVLLGYYGFLKYAFKLSLYWLIAASLFFYSWWNAKYLALLLLSIFINFVVGCFVVKLRSKFVLAIGITLNLSLLAYFKYYNFFMGGEASIILPLAISFFTFQQIAYLVDLYQNKIKQDTFLNYTLFISFFPQLIAGPIVHYTEMMPQFVSKFATPRMQRNISIGLMIFFIGLCKKVVLADNIAPFANQVFQASETGMLLTPIEAWLGALAYSFQLYFDFSGYSDMALGLARCFGIKLPFNFHSPYKADSIIEFWRRWHMTLSRFLRDYLYIPLGGNRKGVQRRYVNLMITMILGGLWHGAGWTYIVWGALHGFYLTINHVWQRAFNIRQNFFVKWLNCSLTFLAVVIAWVFFRSKTFESAVHLISRMFSWDSEILPAFFGRQLPILVEWGVPVAGEYVNHGHVWPATIGWMSLMAVIIWFLPNTQQFMRYWRPTWIHATAMAMLTLFTLMSMNTISEFLYYQF